MCHVPETIFVLFSPHFYLVDIGYIYSISIKFIVKAIGPQKMATGRSSSMPHEMTSPSSTLKQTKLQQLHPQNQQQLRLKGPRHLAFIQNSQNRNSHKQLTPQQACLQGTQVMPSFTGSLGSSHITTSASTSLEASFPHFELRMTSQTTTALNHCQKFLGRENHLERKSSCQNFAPISVFKPFFSI